MLRPCSALSDDTEPQDRVVQVRDPFGIDRNPPHRLPRPDQSTRFSVTHSIHTPQGTCQFPEDDVKK